MEEDAGETRVCLELSEAEAPIESSVWLQISSENDSAISKIIARELELGKSFNVHGLLQVEGITNHSTPPWYSLKTAAMETQCALVS